MTSRLPTVAELATEAGLDSETALLNLLDAGLSYTNPSATVWFRDLRSARGALGLPPARHRQDPCLITLLASRAGQAEDAVREQLVRAGLIEKRRLKRVPTRFLAKAEALLGLAKPTSRPLTQDRGSVAAISTPTDPAASTTRPPRRRPKTGWPTIGPIQDLVFLTPSDVVDLHWVPVEDFAKSKDPIDPPGVRSAALLGSALYRPRTALGATDKYSTLAMAAAALLHSLVLDHPFHNGNKRTALVTLLVFLDKNGWVRTSSHDEIYDILLQLAAHRLVDRHGGPVEGPDGEVLHLAQWLQGRIRRVVRREHPLQFRQLRAILTTYGCTFEHAPGRGNRINIRCGAKQTQVFYRNEGEDVESNKYRKLLDRLAKV